MFSRLIRWINERWPLSPFIRLSLEEEMAGGSSFAYVFGSAALIIFFLQVATGIWQLFYYVPTLAEGYNSLNYLRTDVPFGWLIHGLHYWGAAAMIICVLLHISQVFIWGAYKRPHELQWMTGVFLFLLTMAMSLTGGALPWDKRSYWLVEVTASAAGSIPLVGDLIKRMMLAGGTIGQLTLSRFFILHAAVLSGTIFAMVAVHLVALRKVGNAGPWNEVKYARKGPFWPDQVFKDALFASLVIVLLIGLSVYAMPPFAGMADPFDASYVPKPEWNYLFFYEALKFLPGKLEVIATMGIPLIGTLVLLLIPFVDRSPERNPLRRPFALAGWVVVIGLLIALTLGGAYSKTEGVGQEGNSPAPPAIQRPAAASPAAPSAAVKAGSDLLASQGCLACHRIGGTGGVIGPDLSAEGLKGRSRQWLSEQLSNPKAHNPASVMPSFAATKPDMSGRIIDFLLGLKEGTAVPAQATQQASSGQTPAAPILPGPHGEPGIAAAIIGSAEHGAILFTRACISCHGPEGKGRITNPGSEDKTIPALNPIDADEFAADPKTFARKIDLFIQHGSRPEGPSPAISMPPLGDTNALTQQEIADLEAYVLYVNGVDRAMIYDPGMSPNLFFIITALFFSLTGLIMWSWWRFGRPGAKKKAGE